MHLSPKTRVAELLAHYSFLEEFLASYNPDFAKLLNPLARNTIGKVATLEMAASTVGIDVHVFIGDVAKAVKDKTGQEVAIMTTAELKERAQKIKTILKDLHASGGANSEALEKRFSEEIADVSAAEIAEIEQELVREGITPVEITAMCDLHVRVMRSSLEKEGGVNLRAGHPIHTAKLENREFEGLARELVLLVNDLTKKNFPERKGQLAGLLSSLSLVDKHYLRKEHELFPALERVGVTAPPQVMWQVHDQIRALLRSASGDLASGKFKELAASASKLAPAILDMIYKEEHVLFPMALEHLSEEDWQKIRKGEEEIGYAFVSPGNEWKPQSSGDAAFISGSGESKDFKEKGELMDLKDLPESIARNARLPLGEGSLTLEQIDIMLRSLPVDISFVDENDELRYYSDTKDRIFTRTPGVIGRKVQNCHPPKSVHIVQRIIDEFRKGTRDFAEFWIELAGKFVHIRYFAMRDADGEYRGTLEVSQDVSGIRKLEGQRRLLDWE